MFLHWVLRLIGSVSAVVSLITLSLTALCVKASSRGSDITCLGKLTKCHSNTTDEMSNWLTCALELFKCSDQEMFCHKLKLMVWSSIGLSQSLKDSSETEMYWWKYVIILTHGCSGLNLVFQMSWGKNGVIEDYLHYSFLPSMKWFLRESENSQQGKKRKSWKE